MTAASNQACIVGIGQTEFSKMSGRSEQQLAAESVLLACKDAGVDPSTIDGMLTFDLDNSDEVDIMRSLGCKEINYTARLPQGGASSVSTIVHAKRADGVFHLERRLQPRGKRCLAGLIYINMA